MFAPRSRLDENALAGQAQTPGPWLNRGPLGSPTKMNQPMTTGKQRKMGDEGGRPGSPKKLFQDARSPTKGATPGPGPSSKRLAGLAPKTPGGPSALRSALGDKTNNNKTPFRYQQRQPNAGQSSPTKSPTKRRAQGSPTKMRKEAPPPQTPAEGNTSYMTMPSARPTSPASKPLPAQVFQTPAANVGKRGMMKQRMGEILDAQRMASAGMDPNLQSDMADPEEQQQHWADGLTEEELYPEIEYMPPPPSSSHTDIVDLHPELDGIPRAAELATLLAQPDFTASERLARPLPSEREPPRTLSVAEALAQEMQQIRMQIQEDHGNSTDDDEPWPDVRLPLKSQAGVRQRPFADPRSRNVSSSASSVAAARSTLPPRTARPAAPPSSLKKPDEARAQREQSLSAGAASKRSSQPSAGLANGANVRRQVSSVTPSASAKSLSSQVSRANACSSTATRRAATGTATRVQPGGLRAGTQPKAGVPASSRSGSGESTSTWSTISGTTAASARSTPSSSALRTAVVRNASKFAARPATQGLPNSRPRTGVSAAEPSNARAKASYTTRRHPALCDFDQEDEAAKYAAEMARGPEPCDQDFELELSLDLATQDAKADAVILEAEATVAGADAHAAGHNGQCSEVPNEEEGDAAETALTVVEAPADSSIQAEQLSADAIHTAPVETSSPSTKGQEVEDAAAGQPALERQEEDVVGRCDEGVSVRDAVSPAAPEQERDEEQEQALDQDPVQDEAQAREDEQDEKQADLSEL